MGARRKRPVARKGLPTLAALPKPRTQDGRIKWTISIDAGENTPDDPQHKAGPFG